MRVEAKGGGGKEGTEALKTGLGWTGAANIRSLPSASLSALFSSIKHHGPCHARLDYWAISAKANLSMAVVGVQITI